jgi:pilus assembly protein CpaF
MFDQVKNLAQKHLITKTDFLKVKDSLSDDQVCVYVQKAIDFVCQQNEIFLTAEEENTLIRQFVSSVISLGPIRPLMEDKTISEIMINGPQKIYVQREGKIELSNVKFQDSKELLYTIQKMLAGSSSGRRVDESSPYVDFSLPDGSRVNVILPPVSLVGPVVTIRKFSSEIETVDDLINLGMLNQEIANFLVAAIPARLNIIFSGATGTGKTTTLNVLSRYIPERERIVTIEDTAELRLKQKHVVSLQSKVANVEGKGIISIGDLFVNSLRMRPDRIIIGEVRGNEALDLIQSISSGHSGSLAIVHGDSPKDCYNRLVTMLLATGIPLNVDEIRRQIASAIDLIVHTELFIDGKRRITHVTDVSSVIQNNEIQLNDLFYFKEEGIKENGQVIGDWVFTGKKFSSADKFIKRNIKIPKPFEV